MNEKEHEKEEKNVITDRVFVCYIYRECNMLCYLFTVAFPG